MVKLSIIIPVYNTEKYLPACLDSVIACASREIEIICVSGDSTDDSSIILERYTSIDNRIIVIKQKGLGLSDARNQGIAKAVGKYLLFIDSDDFVNTNYLEQLIVDLFAYPQADLFVTDYTMVFVKKGRIHEKKIYQIDKVGDKKTDMSFLPHMLKHRKCFWNVWRYVYKREFIEQNKILFKVGSLCEDVDFTTKVFLAHPEVMFLHCPFYYYRVARADSLMGHITVKQIRDTIVILDNSIRMLNDSDFPWKQNLIEQYQFEFFLTMDQLYEISLNERISLERLFKERLPLLLIGDDRISHGLYYICSIIGINSVAYLLMCFRSLKRNGRKFWPINKEI